MQPPYVKRGTRRWRTLSSDETEANGVAPFILLRTIKVKEDKL